VERDRWDWLLYIVSLATAFTALIVFLPWALERRRRPEARIIWALSWDGDPANMGSWPPDHVPQVTPGQAFFVQVAVLNVGDRASEDALVNFVVPTASTYASTSIRRLSHPVPGTPPPAWHRNTGSPTSTPGLNHGLPAIGSPTTTGSPTRPLVVQNGRCGHGCC
jgi:hypothetical protein